MSEIEYVPVEQALITARRIAQRDAGLLRRLDAAEIASYDHRPFEMNPAMCICGLPMHTRQDPRFTARDLLFREPPWPDEEDEQ